MSAPMGEAAKGGIHLEGESWQWAGDTELCQDSRLHFFNPSLRCTRHGTENEEGRIRQNGEEVVSWDCWVEEGVVDMDEHRRWLFSA